MNVSLLQFLSLVLGFGLWAALGFFGKVPLDPLIALLQMGLGGLITHMLKGAAAVQASAPPGPASGQAGFASLRLLTVIAAIALGLSIAGCTTTTAAVARGYMTSAEAGVQAFDDNTIEANVKLLCWSPYGAVVRHPEKQVGIQALCGSLANTSTLDANQLQLLMNVMSASGVKLQSVPAAAPPAPAASGAK